MPIFITYNGNNVTNTNLTAWQILGVERTEAGGYELILKGATTAGRYQSWGLDASGAYQDHQQLTAEQLLAKENRFQQDFNGDEQIGGDNNTAFLKLLRYKNRPATLDSRG